MGKISKGASVGQIDMNFKQIKVGDQLKNKHTGGLYVVTNYGTLQNTSTEDKVKKWCGDDYIVVKSWDPAEDLLQNIKEAADIAEPAPVVETKDPNGLVDFSSKELVEELRLRGYTVDCWRQIIEKL